MDITAKAIALKILSSMYSDIDTRANAIIRTNEEIRSQRCPS